jgi:hypothetical protein
MTYGTGNKILASDLNSFISTFNNIWATGSGSSGYGQTAIPSVTKGNVIKASDLTPLVNNLQKALQHQVTTFTEITTPTADTKVTTLSNLSYNITSADNNRLNAGFPVDISTYQKTATSQLAFTGDQTISVTAIFGSHDKARYFFNAGGQFDLNFSHPNGSVATVASYLSTLRFGAGTQKIGGTNYNAVSYLGIVGSRTVYTSRGFYGIGSGGAVASNLIAWSISGSAIIEVYASYDGAGRLTFTMLSYAWVGIQPFPAPVILAGSKIFVRARMPLTTYLEDSWGPISFETSEDETGAPEESELTIMSEWYTNRSKYVRTGLSPYSYPNLNNDLTPVYGEYYQWNSPHIRYYNGYYTETFSYNTSSAPINYSEYFTVVTCVNGSLGVGRLETPKDFPSGNFNEFSTWGQLVTTQYKIYTGGAVSDRTQPNNQFSDGLAYRISIYKGKLASNYENYIEAPQSGANAGSWTYQFVIAGKWGVAKEEVDFSTTASRTIGPGRMAVILSIRPGNFGGLQQAATPYAINYDTWWYNAGNFQINPNPTSSPINVDLRQWNLGSPRVYLELSKDGGAATPTTTSPPAAPPPAPPPFDPAPGNPGFAELPS